MLTLGRYGYILEKSTKKYRSDSVTQFQNSFDTKQQAGNVVP